MEWTSTRRPELPRVQEAVRALRTGSSIPRSRFGAVASLLWTDAGGRLGLTLAAKNSAVSRACWAAAQASSGPSATIPRCVRRSPECGCRRGAAEVRVEAELPPGLRSAERILHTRTAPRSRLRRFGTTVLPAVSRESPSPPTSFPACWLRIGCKSSNPSATRVEIASTRTSSHNTCNTRSTDPSV